MGKRVKSKQPVRLQVKLAYKPTPDSGERLKRVLALLLRHSAKAKEGEDAKC